MRTYFIADDNGDLYAHDIPTFEEADAILSDILAENPEYEKLNLEVLPNDTEDME